MYICDSNMYHVMACTGKAGNPGGQVLLDGTAFLPTKVEPSSC